MTNTTSGLYVQMQGNITTTNAVPLSLNGYLENLSGNNTYTGVLWGTNTPYLQSDAGTLNLSYPGMNVSEYAFNLQRRRRQWRHQRQCHRYPWRRDQIRQQHMDDLRDVELPQ